VFEAELKTMQKSVLDAVSVLFHKRERNPAGNSRKVVYIFIYIYIYRLRSRHHQLLFK